jgi:peptide/nickel transport system substrate-binding protein
LKPSFLIVLLVLSLLSCRAVPSDKPDSISISVPYEVDVLDPHSKTRLSNYAASANFYEPLIGTDDANKILPRLARSWENPDAFTWVFHLQQNVRFHDGKLFDASDVIFSFQRIRSDPNLEVSSYLNDVKEVKALSSNRVQVRTKTPLAIFLNKINNVLIVPAGASAEALSTGINGTGPYTLKEWVPGKLLRLERNKNYWGKKPELNHVTYYLNRTPELAVNDLLRGKCQFIQYDSKKLEPVIRSLTNKYEILRQDNYFLKYLSYDVARRGSKEVSFASRLS